MSATTPWSAWAQGRNPFDLAQRETYLRWRDRKFADLRTAGDNLVVEIADPLELSEGERSALLTLCRRANMAIYACSRPPGSPKAAVRRLGRQLGLRRLDHNLCADADGIASLHNVTEGRPQEYIPYSNRPIRWHTDGYYNPAAEQVRAFVLHCVSDAVTGGANRLLDPEAVYALLRDRDPAYVEALMRPNAMTIPANKEGDSVLRQAQSGPVFSIHPESGSLHMRYTARTRSIAWAADALTREAVAYLESLLNSDLPYIFRYRLQPGQGVLCNNVLHTREAFQDDTTRGKQRLYLRARYYDRIAGT